MTDQRNQIDQLPAPRREMVPGTFGFSKVQPRFWRVPNSEWEPIRNAPGHGGLTPFRKLRNVGLQDLTPSWMFETKEGLTALAVEDLRKVS